MGPRLLILLVVLAGSLACSRSVDRSGSPADFNEFQCRLTGHWDNVKQANADIAAGAIGEQRHPRRAMSYVPVPAPSIKGRLFAIHSYTEQGFDGPLSRVALHRFRPEDNHIVHEFMFLREPQLWGDLEADLSPLSELSEADVRINKNCVMYWRKDDNDYEGATVKGQCVTRSFTPEPIRIEGHGELKESQLIRHDQNFTLDGDPLPLAGGASPERFDKVTVEELATIGCIEAR